MKFLCINLPQAADRRAHCDEQFKIAGIDVKYLRAFHGRESRLKHESDWISNQIGACISHYMAVEFARINDEITVIFEDDIKLTECFKTKLGVLLSQLHATDSNWDVCALAYFGANGNNGDVPKFKDVGNLQKVTFGDVYGQAAYIVNGARGAENILNYITPIRSHIDKMFWECCRDGYLNGYFVKDQFVTQGWDFPSQNV